MTMDECLETYRKQLDNVFGYPQRRLRILGGLLSPKYKSDQLLRIIRLVVKGHTEDGDAERWKQSLFASPNTKCKTYDQGFKLHSDAEFVTVESSPATARTGTMFHTSFGRTTYRDVRVATTTGIRDRQQIVLYGRLREQLQPPRNTFLP